MNCRLILIVMASFTVTAWADPPRGIPHADVAQELRTLVRGEPEATRLWATVESRAESYLGKEPQPVEVIFYEGLLDTDPRRVATVEALYDIMRVELWLSAWLITDEDRYAEAVTEYLLAWAGTYVPTGNPINENKLDPLLTATVALIDGLDDSAKEAVVPWLETMAEAEIRTASEMGWSVRNNWHPKRVKVVALIAEALDRDDWREWALEQTREYIAGVLYADGSSRDFKQRDALSYHIGGVRPLLRLISLLPPEERRGLYFGETDDGASVARSVAFLVPYVVGEKKHEEFRNTTVAMDRWRAEEGLARYQPGTLFEPRRAVSLFQLAAAFEPEYKELAAVAADKPGARFIDWTGVLAAAGWLIESSEREFE